MSDVRTILEEGYSGATPPPDGFERMLRRRDRKRRNQRITAGVVGIAVFVAAIWVVTSVGPLNRSETSVVPQGDVTGPAETGLDVTDVTGPTQAPDAEWDGEGLPPEGTELSTPVEGQLIGEDREMNTGFVYVYADGRVIWYAWGTGIFERRLTPEAVDLVRSGAISAYDLMPPVSTNVPAGVYADAKARPYAPSKYAVCSGDPGGYEDPARLLRLLPAPAEAVLRGKERTYRPGTVDRRHGEAVVKCFEVTTEEARVLDQILEEAGFQAGVEAFFGFNRTNDEAGVSFEPILPHGTWHFWGG
jgi:hypothetical protein